nr:MAG TPA: hypothetical protein [Caudoviricetes sp.]
MLFIFKLVEKKRNYLFFFCWKFFSFATLSEKYLL